MKFNLWLVILLALMPVFILFAGLSAAGGFATSDSLLITGLMAAAALAAGYLAFRRAGESTPAPASESLAKDRVAAGASVFDEGPTAGYASPPCYLHELDDTEVGYWSREETLALLNELLEAERAGARGVREMSEGAASGPMRTTLRRIAGDEARFCAMLFGHIRRLGATPSVKTGTFHEKLASLEALDDRLDLLNRGQGWVARRLRDALPSIGDYRLRADLQAMLATHERNIDRCAHLVQSRPA